MAKESWGINPAGIHLSKKSATSLYIQIYEQFREMILSGRLRAGERLPASRNLAKELGVSRVIVNRGYEQLIIEGYLVGKTGSGTFVADTLPDHMLNAAATKNLAASRNMTTARPVTTAYPAAANSASAPAAKNAGVVVESQPQSNTDGAANRVVPFLTGTPSLDLFPYKTWHAVGNKVLKNMKGINLSYDDTLGCRPLREAIATYLRISRAVKCEADQVVVVTGSQQGLNLIAECLLQKGDKVWMEDPGYPGAISTFRQTGTEICPVPVEADGLNVKYAIRKYGGAKMVYTTPSHQWPTGGTLSQEKRLQLLSYAQQKKMWILEDDYDSEFRYEGRPLASLQGQDQYGNVIYTGTFSKVLFPGLRLAYLVLPTTEMVAQFGRVKVLLDRQSPILDQLMVAAFMQDGYFLRHIRKMRLLYAERQQILLQLIREQLAGYLIPNAAHSGMQLFCQLSDKIDADRLRTEVRRLGLIVYFVRHHGLKRPMPPAIILGFTAFSRFRLKTGIEKLVTAVQNSLI